MSSSGSFIAALAIGIALEVAEPAAAENVLRWASVGSGRPSIRMPTTIPRPPPRSSGLRGVDRARLQPGTGAAAGRRVATGRSNDLGVPAAPERPVPRRHAAHCRRRRVQHRTRQGRSSWRLGRSLAGRIEEHRRGRARSMSTPCTSKSEVPGPAAMGQKVRPHLSSCRKRWAEAARRHEFRSNINARRGELRVAARERHRAFYPEESSSPNGRKRSWSATPTGGASSGFPTTLIGSSHPPSPTPRRASPRCSAATSTCWTGPPSRGARSDPRRRRA